MAGTATQTSVKSSSSQRPPTLAATNVQGVAAATEELSSSINEIGRQVEDLVAHRRAGRY